MTIRWHPQAAADLTRIHSYIAQENPIAASSISERILRSVDRLDLFPLSGRPGKASGTREIVVLGLPYVVVYRHDDPGVSVVGVIHGAQQR